VIVSHNRDFLDPVVTKTLEFRVGQPPQMYAGNLSYFLEKKAEEKARGMDSVVQVSGPPSKSRADDEPQNAKERRRIEAQKRQERARVLRPLQDKLKFVEEEIARLEEEKAGITRRMAEEGFGSDAEEVRMLTARYATVETSLEKVFTQWSDVSEEVERAEKALGVEA
jgi:ATP-binding cassette subfamily F protein 3